MSQIAHVLVGTDLSDGSADVIRRAAQVAGTVGARLTVLHALGLEAPTVVRSVLGMDTEQLTEQATDSATRRLFQSLGGLDLGETRVDGVVQAGLAGPTIAAYCGQHAADLLVIGDRGSGLLQRVLFGSTASHLLRTSPTPILVVKTAPDRPYRDVLVAVDFSPASAASVRLAQTLAPDARLHLLHVATLPLEAHMRYAGAEETAISAYRSTATVRAEAALEKLANEAGLAPEEHVRTVVGGDPTEQIVNYVETHGCGLVALGKHGTHRPAELLLGSVTRKVLAAARNDALVVVDAEAPIRTVSV